MFCSFLHTVWCWRVFFHVRPITTFQLDWGLDFDLAMSDFSISLFWAILLWICLHVLGHYHVENSIYGSASTFLLMVSHSFQALLVVMWNSSLPGPEASWSLLLKCFWWTDYRLQVVWNPPFVDWFTYSGMIDSLEMPISPFPHFPLSFLSFSGWMVPCTCLSKLD